MRIEVEHAAVALDDLLVRVESGEEIELTRDGVPVARLLRAAPPSSPATFLARWGALRGQIIETDFEFTEAEIDEMLDGPA